MGDRYPIPADTTVHEIEIQRSRFRASVAPAASVEEARAFIDDIRTADPDATHHCWAYLIGPPASSDRVGMSDDGEPHGTAGRPMLHVLSHSGIGDVVAVVTRWYGGVKLGTGGLTRAYSDAVRETLEQMSTTERISWAHLRVSIDYAALDPLKRLLPDLEAEILDETYADRVTLALRVPEEGTTHCIQRITEMSNGSAVIESTQG